MKIGYSKTYPVTAYWEKNWLEDDFPTGLTIDSTDEEIAEIMKKVRRIQYALKAQVESFHYEATAAAEKQKVTAVTAVGAAYYNEKGETVGVTILEVEQHSPDKKQTREQAITQQINECTDLKVLESFSMLAKNYPDIKEAYDNKLQLLLQSTQS